jgi:hydroxymethylpyrimidine/phosphomethylpyrimidine kinase
MWCSCTPSTPQQTHGSSATLASHILCFLDRIKSLFFA